VDDCGGESGQIAGGWSVDILTTTTAVRLRSFGAEPSRTGTVLRWRTASEFDVLGFNLYREVRGQRVRVNRALIAARGRGTGASYRFVDRALASARSVVYRLQVVNLDGSRTWAGTARVAAR